MKRARRACEMRILVTHNDQVSSRARAAEKTPAVPRRPCTACAGRIIESQVANQRDTIHVIVAECIMHPLGSVGLPLYWVVREVPTWVPWTYASQPLLRRHFHINDREGFRGRHPERLRVPCTDARYRVPSPLC